MGHLWLVHLTCKTITAYTVHTLYLNPHTHTVTLTLTPTQSLSTITLTQSQTRSHSYTPTLTHSYTVPSQDTLSAPGTPSTSADRPQARKRRKRCSVSSVGRVIEAYKVMIFAQVRNVWLHVVLQVSLGSTLYMWPLLDKFWAKIKFCREPRSTPLVCDDFVSNHSQSVECVNQGLANPTLHSLKN